MDPKTCGRRCYSGSDNYTLPDLLRWAPLTPNELDGDPAIPDVLPNMVSLVDGARRYLEQKYGADSPAFLQLVEAAQLHGITPDLSP